MPLKEIFTPVYFDRLKILVLFSFVIRKKLCRAFTSRFKFLKRKVFVILNACGPFLRYCALFGVS